VQVDCTFEADKKKEKRKKAEDPRAWARARLDESELSSRTAVKICVDAAYFAEQRIEAYSWALWSDVTFHPPDEELSAFDQDAIDEEMHNEDARVRMRERLSRESEMMQTVAREGARYCMSRCPTPPCILSSRCVDEA
jgi:hypothetical protein